MITINQTAGNDNALIWIVETYLSGTYYRYAVAPNLSTFQLDTGSEMNTYSGVKILKDSLSLNSESLPYESSGGVGSLGGFSFSLASFGTIGLNDFYPANTAHTSKMIGRLGFCWSNATLTSHITWLFDNCICENFSFAQEGIYFEFVQRDELQRTELPPYKVQKDLDDKISYFPIADDEIYGASIPIVYGNFNYFTPEFGLVLLAPALLVDKQSFKILVASHKVYRTYNDAESKVAAFQWVNGAENYIELMGDSSTENNNLLEHSVILLNNSRTSGDYIKGKLYIVKKMAGKNSDINDVQYLLDNETTTELTVSAGDQAAVRFDNTVSDSEVGLLGITSTDVSLQVQWTTSVDGSNRGLEIGYYNELKPGGAGYSSTSATETHNDADSDKITTFSFGAVTADQSDTALPWDLREVLGLDFYLKNVSGTYGGTTSGTIKIVNAWLVFDNIIVNNSLTKRLTYRGLTVKPTITGIGVKLNIKLGRR